MYTIWNGRNGTYTANSAFDPPSAVEMASYRIFVRARRGIYTRGAFRDRRESGARVSRNILLHVLSSSSPSSPLPTRHRSARESLFYPSPPSSPLTQEPSYVRITPVIGARCPRRHLRLPITVKSWKSVTPCHDAFVPNGKALRAEKIVRFEIYRRFFRLKY